MWGVLWQFGFLFFFQAEDGIRDYKVTGVQTCALPIWVNKMAIKEVKVRYVMEATGVYHEKLAYYLSDQEQEVSIVLPNKISNYFRTLDIKTITDKTASQAICRFGLERKLEVWQKPKKIFKDLKQLDR